MLFYVALADKNCKHCVGIQFAVKNNILMKPLAINKRSMPVYPTEIV